MYIKNKNNEEIKFEDYFYKTEFCSANLNKDYKLTETIILDLYSVKAVKAIKLGELLTVYFKNTYNIFSVVNINFATSRLTLRLVKKAFV